MALASGNSDPFSEAMVESVSDRLSEGIRSDAEKSRFNAVAPRDVKRVSADEQRARAAEVEARNADLDAQYRAEQAAIVEQLAGGQIQGSDAFEARFQEALVAAVSAKAGEVALARPNGHTATEGDLIRWRERVAADERAKIEAAAKPAAADDFDADWLADLSADADAVQAADGDGDDDTDDGLVSVEDIDSAFEPEAEVAPVWSWETPEVEAGE